jgi:hypothetical protein
MSKRPPGCFKCKDFHPRSATSPSATPSLTAPGALYFGEIDHLKPLPGENGIQWEPAEGVIGPPALRLLRGGHRAA